MANRQFGALILALAQIFAGSAPAAEIRSLAETGGALPATDYIVVIDRTTACFYTAAWELVASGHFRAPPPDKQEMRAEALGFVLQVTGHHEQADNAIFMIISDRYKPPHYEALIQGIRLTKDLHRESQAR